MSTLDQQCTHDGMMLCSLPQCDRFILKALGQGPKLGPSWLEPGESCLNDQQVGVRPRVVTALGHGIDCHLQQAICLFGLALGGSNFCLNSESLGMEVAKSVLVGDVRAPFRQTTGTTQIPSYQFVLCKQHCVVTLGPKGS